MTKIEVGDWVRLVYTVWGAKKIVQGIVEHEEGDYYIIKRRRHRRDEEVTKVSKASIVKVVDQVRHERDTHSTNHKRVNDKLSGDE